MSDSGSELNHLRKILEASGIGIWNYNANSGEASMDDKAKYLFGFNETDTNLNKLLQNTFVDDVTLINAAIATAITPSGGNLDVKYRITDRDKKIRWVHVKASKISDDDNLQTRFEGTIQEIGEQLYQGQDNEARFRSLIEQAPVATCLFVGRDMVIELSNNLMLGYWGVDRSAIGKKLSEAVPEVGGQEFMDFLDNVYTTGRPHSATELPAVLKVGGVLSTYYFDFTYQPIVDANGEVYGVMNMSIDVTERVLAKKKVQESQSRFRVITEQSPMAIGLLVGKDMVIEVANDKILEIWGKDSSAIGQPLLDVIPEIRDQEFPVLLNNVFTTGEPFYGYSTLVKLEHNGELKDFYIDFTYTPLREDNSIITGVLVLAIDVTQRVLTTKKIEDSEAKFRSLIEAAPAGIGLFVGRDLIVDSPNQTFIDIVGKGPDIAGKPLREVMPELESQIFLQILDDVYTSGKMFHSYGTQVNIVQHGVMSYNYYNITYTPLLNSEGEVYAILDIAIDVTESILARQATEAAEASLRGAIELAELGTWTLMTETRIVTYSQRMLEWYGFTGEPEELQDVYNIIDEKDRQRVADAIANALLPDSDGVYDEEYVIKNRVTGRERVLHAQGKAAFDKDGKAYMISGTAQDITTQRKLQMTLENEVKARTNELQAANKELEESNRNLTHSNEELAQYAYVASHDLQEPLRKISMFSNLLKERDIEGTHTTIANKIVNASQRMSLLIKDLLEFSRLLNPDVHFIATDLNGIVKAIVDDFELLIEEKQASVNIGPLPVIDAIPLHMNQLFNNLMSNALKFMPVGVQPVISISAEKISSADASKMMYNTNPASDYYRITVKDNGIGIEDKYVKQIFEVFKRLHGRDEYYGSGIGLAICRRIVTNHSGAITIESEPGRGTAFHILLPENQTKQSL